MKPIPFFIDGIKHTAQVAVTMFLKWDGKSKNTFPLKALFLIFFGLGILQLNAQCNLNCLQNVQIALDESGQALVTPNVLLQQYPLPGCFNNLAIEIKDAQGKSYPTTLTCNEKGKTLFVKVTDLSNGNYCNTQISIIDQLSPHFSIINYTIFCSDPKSPDLLGYPTVTDNCTTITNDKLLYVDNVIDLPCNTIQNGVKITGKIIRTWSAVDGSGNTATAIQIINLKTAKLSDVVFPPDRDGIQAPKLDCTDNPNDLKKTGEPSINGFPIVNGGSCDMVIQKSDQTFNTCVSGSYSVLRTWTVIDYCVDSFTVHVQVIKREDNKGPVVEKPLDITVGTQSNSCTAIVSLPSTTATDNCSNFTIIPTWAFGQGYGPFQKVPVGVHVVNYTATDDCGNKTTVNMTVTVVDDDLPVAVCKKDLTITLNDKGLVTAPSSLFDDGSFDNCALQSIQVSKNNDPFGNTIAFDCSDIGVPINVKLRVYDTANQSNVCYVAVTVTDPVAPIINCPADVTLSCTLNANDLSLTGQATATDNCGVGAITYSDTKNLNSCNQGTIIRKWSVVDKYNNTAQCVQKISLIDLTPLNVSFPIDYTSNVCGTPVTTDKTGAPSFTNNDCEQLDVNYVDQFFNTAPPACYKIVRKWTVRDWCTFDPNIPGKGIWEKNQVIQINDIDAPVLKVPADMTVGSTSTTSCIADVTIPPATATDCNPNVAIVNNSSYSLAKNANASGKYPVGIHTITYTAYDGCGNSSTAFMKLTVVDIQPPVPACVNGLSIPLNTDGIATITLGMIEVGTLDNCTPKSSIKFDLTPSTFNCTNIGNNTVTLTAIDESGNSSFCTTTVNIQDNLNYCSQVVKIAGTVYSIEGEEMKNVQIQLNGESAQMTDNAGHYEYKDLPKGTNFTIDASKDEHILKGISTLDLLLMTKHILGIKALDSPYKIIAADVNHSGNVTTADVVALKRAILQLDTKFPNNTSWRFVDANEVFNNPLKPFAQSIQEKVIYDNILTNKLNADWIGVKVGDVNASVNPNAANGANEVRNSNGVLEFKTKDINLKSGYEYHIPISSNNFNDINGFQYTFEFNPEAIEILTVVPAALKSMNENSIGLNYEEHGKVAVSCVEPLPLTLNPDDVLFELVIRAKSDTRLSDMITMGSSLIQAEAYDKSEELLDVNLSFDNAKENKFFLGQNLPNPFEFQTTIPFQLKDAGDVTVQIFDMLGNLIHSYNGLYPQGENTILVTAQDLNNISGIYYYQLQVKGKRKLTNKMVLMHE